MNTGDPSSKRPAGVAELAVEYAAVTEQVALKVARLEGAGDTERAYALATRTFREGLGEVSAGGRLAILRENRPDEKGNVRVRKVGEEVLRVGDLIGHGEGRMDLAVEPVEGLELLAGGQNGALSAVAAAPRGSIMQMPDMYMSKLIVAPQAKGSIDIDVSASENVEAIAEASGLKPSEMTVAVLDRDRHRELIEEIRSTGARIQIRPAGDLTPAIAVGVRGSGIHAVIGIGGAPEGILAAAVVKCLGGEIQARMWPTQRSQISLLQEFGLDDPEKKLTTEDLIGEEEVIFAATGITDGETLKGVQYFRSGGRTHSVVMSTRPRMIRFIDTIHALEPEAVVQGFQL